ncbi:DNA polymerase III subunit alpha [Enterococcus phoeniculicola]|uniref:DNA polymerase III subunit alpha n=1 Tax=Enterococcus phoeniculicola ATCC BAA-412 TaxID=1158610 RepID=R3WJ01_9ENTE|nr:DNA polymerase III subunit alpha [Enterococcus phoeniculicola]EOL41860.1 DNA polymerase III, alpha subunit [Enterococcus phoeniculicola ATCC BAA-412]EOT79861.1 DNA polymerase III, alpha subunit [Enterococcus phoeniculicola ATCC BAA-412]
MFPQLYTITSYSLLQSTVKIPQYVEEAKKRGYQTIAVTDRNTMHGAVEFFQSCQTFGMKPVFGLWLDYESNVTQRTHSLVLYAKNYSGYQHLMRLSSIKMIEGSLRLEDHEALFSDLFAVIPEENEFSELAVENHEEIEARLEEVLALFEKQSVYVGVTSEAHFHQEDLWSDLQEKFRLPLAAVHKVNYLNSSEVFAVEVMKHIQEGTQIETGKMQQISKQGTEYLVAEAEIRQLFLDKELDKAIENACLIARECQVELPLHQTLLPHYPVPGNEAPHTYLRRLCFERIESRVETLGDEYYQRLEYELSIIHQMGFDDYFLIVWDVMDFAHKHEIVTGAGRGSGAGSLVAYVLSITDVDPIEYQLLFERFLNPERYTMPDFDLDIPDNRREEVLQYVKEKYGQFHMAQIATFGTMAAKMVLRDVSRVFGLSQSEANRWSQAVPNALKMTLSKAYEESQRFVELVNASSQNQLLYQTAKQLEGLPRHVSTHAAGVVISDQDLLELVPLQEGTDGIFLTQFTMTDVETVGLLKMDFLGLRNLSIIDNTLKSIKRIYKEELDLKKIPLDDPETLALFQRGETSGVFQFESAGIRNVLRKLGPTDIEDIAAVNALYRPGPMQNIDTFIRRKKGQEPIHYPEESLKEILSNTYGIIVYQEQIMQVASKMAGFSLGQADILRRAISKKKKDVLDEQRRNFVSGSVKQGHTEKKANEIYDYIERFADYGFNRSHAFAYSFVGFQMAYLKVHYPAPFYGALLHSVRHHSTKMKEYINEARKQKLEIVPPSINQSNYSFTVKSAHQLLFGFSGIKGIRRDFIQAIIDERKAEGRYKSFDQFLLRLDKKWLKTEYLEPMISIGVFDELVPNRRQLLKELDGKIQNVLFSSGSESLLDILTLKEEEISDFTLEEKLELENNYLGIYLSGHPTENYERVRRAKQVTPISDITPNQTVNLLVYVRSIREIRTKKGEQMAFIEGNDVSGEVSLTVFPRNYRASRTFLKENQVILVSGKVERNTYNQELQVLADTIQLAEEADKLISKVTCFLRVTPERDQPEIMSSLQKVFRQHKGSVPIIIFFEQSGKKIGLNAENWIEDSQEVKNQLSYILGEENVVFR